MTKLTFTLKGHCLTWLHRMRQGSRIWKCIIQHIDTLPKYGKKKSLDVRRST